MGRELGPVIRVGIVDARRAFLIGISTMINAREGFHVVSAGRTIAELVLFSRRIDVVLLGPTASETTGGEGVREVLARVGARMIDIVDDAGEAEEGRRRITTVGAVDVVHRSDDVAQMLDKIRVAARLVPAAGASADGGGVELSAREAEVLGLYASGATADAVSRALFITRETVLDHIRRIRSKYSAAGRPAVTKVDLFRRAVEDGLVSSEA